MAFTQSLAQIWVLSICLHSDAIFEGGSPKVSDSRRLLFSLFAQKTEKVYQLPNQHSDFTSPPKPPLFLFNLPSLPRKDMVETERLEGPELYQPMVTIGSTPHPANKNIRWFRLIDVDITFALRVSFICYLCVPQFKKSFLRLHLLIQLSAMVEEKVRRVGRNPRKVLRVSGRKGSKFEKRRKRGGAEGASVSSSAHLNAAHYSMFESSTSYVLDDLNSIAFVNDRIYNLLKLKPRNSRRSTLKCKCTKSRCEARYCDCFSHGQVCSIDCSCLNCNNLTHERHENGQAALAKEEAGCKCSKSECMKNYCECFQKGQICTSKCKCQNCRNFQ